MQAFKPWLVFFLSLCAIVSLRAAGKPEESIVIPDIHEQFSVGVSEFRGVNLSPENTYLEESIPLMLFEQLSVCREHEFSEAQGKSYKQFLIDSELADIDDALESSYQKLDALFFSSDVKEEELDQAITELTEHEARRKDVLSVSPEDVSIQHVKPVVLKSFNELKRLYPSPLYRKVVSRENDLDLLISGSVEQIEEFFIVSFAVYSVYEDATVFEAEQAVTGNSLHEKVETIGDSITSLVLGRGWSNIIIEAEPDDARIVLDGVFLGRGRVVQELLAPGEYTLEVSHRNYETITDEIRTADGETTEISVSLAKRQTLYQGITSYPPGADVYIASKWAGKTPLIVTEPPENSLVSISREGYRNYDIEDFQDLGTDVRIRLNPADIDYGEYIDERRDRVYTSLSFFVASLPIPLVFYNLSQEYATGFYMAASEGNTEELERMFNRTAFYYHGYVGSFILSASLFINSVVHLVGYINTARRN